MDVFGTVRDAGSQLPIGDAKVTLSVDGNELAVLYSDDKGQFEYRDADSYTDQTLTCLIEKPGYDKREVTREVKQDEVRLEIELGTPPVEKIQFRLSVTDGEGKALEGAGITLKVGEEQVGAGHSDKAGLFEATVSQSYEGKTLTYTAKRLLYTTETGQVRLAKETSAEVALKRTEFPLWAKIAAGITAVVIVVLVIWWLVPNGNVVPPSNTPPSVEFLNPMHGDTYLGQQTVEVVVRVEDEDGIQKVEIQGRTARYEPERKRAKRNVTLRPNQWTRIVVSATDRSGEHKKSTEDIFVQHRERGIVAEALPERVFRSIGNLPVIPEDKFKSAISEGMRVWRKELEGIREPRKRAEVERKIKTLDALGRTRTRGELRPLEGTTVEPIGPIEMERQPGRAP